MTKPTPFRGDSPSSRPVTWFWRVFRGTNPIYDVTSEARGKSKGVQFAAKGALTSLFLALGAVAVAVIVAAGASGRARALARALLHF